MNQKRSVELFGRDTSISLEKEFWDALDLMCAEAGVGKFQMIERIAKTRPYENLSSSIRVRALQWMMERRKP